MQGRKEVTMKKTIIMTGGIKNRIVTDYNTEKSIERTIVSNPEYRVFGNTRMLTFRVALRNGDKADCLNYRIRGERAEHIWKSGVLDSGLFTKGARIFHNVVNVENRTVVLVEKGEKITVSTFFPGEMIVSSELGIAVF